MHLPPVRRHTPLGPAVRLLAACWAWLLAAAVFAQGVELATLGTSRADGALNLEFSARLTLPRAVEDALTRGVPVYFVDDGWYQRNVNHRGGPPGRPPSGARRRERWAPAGAPPRPPARAPRRPPG